MVRNRKITIIHRSSVINRLGGGYFRGQRGRAMTCKSPKRIRRGFRQAQTTGKGNHGGVVSTKAGSWIVNSGAMSRQPGCKSLTQQPVGPHPTGDDQSLVAR